MLENCLFKFQKNVRNLLKLIIIIIIIVIVHLFTVERQKVSHNLVHIITLKFFIFYLNLYKIGDRVIFIWKKIICHIFLYLCHVSSLGTSCLNFKFIGREYEFLTRCLWMTRKLVMPKVHNVLDELFSYDF